MKAGFLMLDSKVLRWYKNDTVLVDLTTKYLNISPERRG